MTEPDSIAATSDYAAPGLLTVATGAVRSPATVESYGAHARASDAERTGAYAALVNSYYDLVTDFFEYGWGDSFHFAPRARGETLRESIRRHEYWLAFQLGLTPQSRVLDVGCGVGGPMRSIARFAGCHVTGLNNNAYQIERAGLLNRQAGLAQQCALVHGDFMAMPLPDNAMDAAYAIEATVHAPVLRDAFANIHRTLRPGGLFATYEWCLTPQYDPANPRHQALKRGIELGNGLPGIATRAEAEQAMAEAGFEILHIEDRCADSDIPWWEPLGPAPHPLRFRRSSGLGLAATNVSVRVLEALRIAPRGTTNVAHLLADCARTLAASGRQRLFTPRPLHARPQTDGTLTQAMTPPLYDVAIVGAGPAGATCAWYLARAGIRVALLDRHVFPRDKVCGDAICSRAQVHLARMGVLQQIMAHDEGHAAFVGGMVSPAGIVAIDSSPQHIASSPVIAIRRIDMDHRIVRAAETAGAVLLEGCDATGATLDADVWTIRAFGGAEVRARTMVAADGATSRLARQLGVVAGGPDAVCSRAYLDAHTSDFAYDGVVFYRRDLLPGYCAVFRQSKGQLSYCLYIIPGGPCENRDLRRMHEMVRRDDPFVSRALGAGAVVSAMRGGPLRLGGVPRSHGDRLIVLGDAAGQIDPLTGEGIQYGMDAAEIAADTLIDGFARGTLDAVQMARYHAGWHRAFGHDFAWSRRVSLLCGRYPRLLDAGAAALRRGGGPLLGQWAEVMTGAKPKTEFLNPGLALPVFGALLRGLVPFGKRGPDLAAFGPRSPADSPLSGLAN